MKTLKERLEQLDRGEIDAHEFCRLQQVEYMAGELIASRFTTQQQRTITVGRCAVCNEKARPGAVRVWLPGRHITLHPHCHRQVYETAAELVLAGNYQHTREEDRAHYDELSAAYRDAQHAAQFRELDLMIEAVGE
jgi:hypothetical protein